MKKRSTFVGNSSSSSFIISSGRRLDRIQGLFFENRWEKINKRHFKSYLLSEIFSELDIFFEPGRNTRYCWTNEASLQPIVYIDDNMFINEIKTYGLNITGIPISLKLTMYNTPWDKNIQDTFENILKRYQSKILDCRKNMSFRDNMYSTLQKIQWEVHGFLSDKLWSIISANIKFKNIYKMTADDCEHTNGMNDEEFARQSMADVECDFKMVISQH